MQQQHAIYHQQQAAAAAQQYGTYGTAAHPPPHHLTAAGQQGQIYQQIPAHIAALQPNGNPHSIYQPLVAVSQGSIYVSNMATMRRQNTQAQGHPQIPAHHVPPHQQQQPQQPPPPIHQPHNQIKSPQDGLRHREVPATSGMDTAIYDRDKGVYKCSTLRQGGKFDPKYKPSILNCPLPEIPKDADPPPVASIYEQKQNYSKTLQRPPMKLPPQMKAIPPPRIGTPTSPPAQNTNAHNESQHVGGGQQQQQQLQQQQMPNGTVTTGVDNRQLNDDSSLPLPPPPLEATTDVGNMIGIGNGSGVGVGGGGGGIVGIHSPPKPGHVLSNNNNNINSKSNISNNNSVNNGINSNNSNNASNNSGGSSSNASSSNNSGNSAATLPLHNGSLANNMDDDDDLPPPPPPAITDDSNYAVTEL